ncbi:GNAT family N-acetyltransferase [Nocardioides carbamazepini]|uniref:GNAT family N-acetyltransferase n=1 Tax=Nocardioides carbamazepini TaxID=2854259 RepID=UPI002149E3FB|nr:GNAT family N-acetyltransferase [Nocardioides carbamazepini]MCR1781984.1 GNAT family N-acetyltransferase [Nocardioides carbamazepini]
MGQRIVVRRVLRGQTGPSGGPAFTDVLGTCLAWDADTCLVERADGEKVRIALADVVSGKPVPPRPPARMRVSARDAEAHTAALWPSVETAPLGAWVLRCETRPSGRLLKRANSCLAMGEPDRPVAAALAEIATYYAARGRDPLVQVETGSDVEAAVAAAGWRPLPTGDSELRLASVSRVRRDLPPAATRPATPVELSVTGVHALAGAGTGCDPIAEGRAAVDGDWVGLHGLSVDPAHRRRGLGAAVVARLLGWAAEQGALTAWLHVETDNADGRAFWEALGFVAHHTCRYYAPSSASAWPDSR